MRNFVFTDFEVDRKDAWLDFAMEEDGPLKYVILQREKCPRSGKEHLQGYAELKKQMRLNAMKKKFGRKVHFEKRKGTAQEAADYCRKEESRVEGPWEAGEISAPGKRSDLDSVKQMLDAGASMPEVADASFGSWCRYRKAFSAYKMMKMEKKDSPKEVFVLWGEAGTGKTRHVYDTEGFELYSKPDGRWFDGYVGQEVALFDDYTGDLPIGLFLKLLDRYPVQVEVKGDWVPWVPKRIYITSNLAPEEWYPNATTVQHDAIRRRITKCTRYSTGVCAGSARNVDGGAIASFNAPVDEVMDDEDLSYLINMM